MMISASLFEAYLECSTKCWLRAHAEPSNGNAYAEWARLRNEAYYQKARKRWLAPCRKTDHIVSPISTIKDAKDAIWRVAIDVHLQTNGLESRLQAVEKVSPDTHAKPVQFIPYRFQFSNKLTKSERMLLAFDALVLSEALECNVSFGKIIHGDRHSPLKVKLSPLVSTVRKEIAGLIALLANDSPPELILNRHCVQCEFQARCRTRAMEKDDLSLLSGISEKERKKLHDRGIFTVTQLSYTFRPRRRRRKWHNGTEKFHHSLRALAIRERKIHVVDLIAQQLDGTPVYIDVEGLPDRDFYYLIGIRAGTGEDALHSAFWADDATAEKGMWNEFLDFLSTIPDPRLIHFGSYETAFLKRMSKRHGQPHEGSKVSLAFERAVNLLSLVFGHIYFPTFSNRLKDIAEYLGFHRSASPRTGLEAIIWRHHWEASGDECVKQALLDYNRDDCKALALVANRIVDLYGPLPASPPSSQNDVIRASEMTQQNPFPLRFGRNTFALPEFEIVNRAAYWDYQRDRIYVGSRNKVARKRERNAKTRSSPIPNTTVEAPRASVCLTCQSTLLYRHGKSSRIKLDLRFMRYGIKRWITRYVAHRYRCRSCGSTFYMRAGHWIPGKYGPALAAYAVYQSIELRLPQSRVAASVGKLFGLYVSRNTVNRFKIEAAQRYASTYDNLLKRLCSGRLLHVDETSAGVFGNDGYVWVLTSMEEVAYFYSPTREGDTIHAMLETFSGVLVSDFYAVYDAIECPQQKCLIHFIRDLNDELLKHPYDDGIRQLGAVFAGLVKPMVETVDRHGLKKHFLGKHRSAVDRFYKHLVAGRLGTGEAARKIVDRLQRNRDKLFTFLEFDNIPWNNNNAEHAIKAFASLRRVFEGKSTEKGLRDFLVLLSINETCKYKGVDFLDFLRSGAIDVDDFAISERKQRLRRAG